MPKTLEYPSATFRSCLEIADAVDALGGTCSVESCAHKLQKQPTSGAFRMIISSAVKYGLLTNTRGNLTVSSDYKLLKHAYNDDEKLSIERSLLLRPEVFNTLYHRFIGKALPITMLDKLMIREMGVDESTAGRVSGYFIKGLKDVGLLSEGNIVMPIEREPNTHENDISEPIQVQPLLGTNVQAQQAQTQSFPTTLDSTADVFTVSITGPGVNNIFQILEEEDLEWVEVAIRKIKRALKTSDGENKGK